MRCENCGHENPEGSKFCMKCGKELGGSGPRIAACPHCGAEVAPVALFCASCGKSIGAPYGEIARPGQIEPPTVEADPGSFTSSIAPRYCTFLSSPCGIYLVVLAGEADAGDQLPSGAAKVQILDVVSC